MEVMENYRGDHYYTRIQNPTLRRTDISSRRGLSPPEKNTHEVVWNKYRQTVKSLSGDAGGGFGERVLHRLKPRQCAGDIRFSCRGAGWTEKQYAAEFSKEDSAGNPVSVDHSETIEIHSNPSSFGDQ